MTIEKKLSQLPTKMANLDIFKEIQRASESSTINKKSPNLVTLLPGVNAQAFRLQHQ
jgi:hypothetical protein